MVVNDNLLSISQTFFSPDSVQKISDVIGQTSEKTLNALKSVIPTLMNGIVDVGSTPEGAAKLVDIINTHEFENINKPDPRLIPEGHDAINGIFGSNLNTIVSKLESATGLGVGSITKMLDMSAPVFMGVLGSKVKYEKTGSLGIMNFLNDQKKAMSGFTTHVTTATSNAHDKIRSYTLPKQEIPWRGVFLAALVLLAVYFWWLAANSIPSPSTITTTVDGQTMANLMKTAPVRDLERFVIEGSAEELPKHFRFEKLRFISGEIGVARGSEPELDRIANALLRNPAAMVRVEGFTDNVGPEERNRRLSAARALHVREKLIDRGIEPGRIEAVGYGSENPIANNSMVHGRAVNNRVELVVTKLK